MNKEEQAIWDQCFLEAIKILPDRYNSRIEAKAVGERLTPEQVLADYAAQYADAMMSERRKRLSRH